MSWNVKFFSAWNYNKLNYQNKIIYFYALITITFSFSGCAVYYQDATTGAEHVWGIGHIATKISAPENGKQAIISKATLAGISFGIEESKIGLSAGFDKRERIVIYDENAAISILRPKSDDFFLFKFGSLPFDIAETEQQSKIKKGN